MAIGEIKRAIGVFLNRTDAEQAVVKLRDAGLKMDKVSIITKNTGANQLISSADMTGNQAGAGAKVGAIAGGATGGLVGLIEGLAVLMIPGVGPIVAAGTVLANTLVSSGLGAAVGGLGGAFIGWGIPEDEARFYQVRVSQGDYLVILEGTEKDTRCAKAILKPWGINRINSLSYSRIQA